MSNSDKRLFSNIIIISCATILIYLGSTNHIDGYINDFPLALFIVMIIAITGGLLYLINYVLLKDIEINRELIEEITEKDYLEQMSDDIHTIKTIIIIFAAIAIVVMIMSLLSITSLASMFNKL